MKASLITTILLFAIAVQGFSQTTTKYYKTRFVGKEVDSANATYALSSTRHANGAITTEWRKMKNNQVISSTTYRGLEPVGVWKYQVGNGVAELNYDFELSYNDTAFNDSLHKASVLNPFMDSTNYTAPKFAGNKKIYQILQQNIVYPEMAKDHGITGRVIIMFIVRKTGEITNVSVVRGCHVVLDKEAARVVREMKIVSPATLNGEPENFRYILPISFTLM